MKSLRSSYFSKALLAFLVLHFINLSANFYQGNTWSKNQDSIEDPIDSVSELIFEWVLDGDQDVIPDSNSGQEDKSFEKIKLVLPYFQNISFQTFKFLNRSNLTFLLESWVSVKLPVAEFPPNL